MVENKSRIDKSAQKLASGLKINGASDDGSALAIADKLRTQVSSINESYSNATRAISMAQIADKAMGEQSKILDKIKQKLIQAKTSTTSDQGRINIAKDIKMLIKNLNEIASTTDYNMTYLLQKDKDDNGPTSEISFQIGELKDSTIDIDEGSIQSNTVGLGLEDLEDENLETNFSIEFAGEQMTKIDKALDKLNNFRSSWGMIQIQLDSAAKNLNSKSTNLSSAESIIRDTNYAQENSVFSRENILTQTGSFAMAQANNIHNNKLKIIA
jgi:flagellin